MKVENTPQFEESSGTLTLPTVTGVTWEVNGRETNPGRHTLNAGVTVKVKAVLAKGFRAEGETEWVFSRPEAPSEASTSNE